MLSVTNLSKSFPTNNGILNRFRKVEASARHIDGRFYALSQVNFSCDKGQVLGVLGPNGAGKTTMLRILSSALKADSGSIVIDGEDIIKKPALAKKKIGVLSNKTGLYQRLTARENIEYFAKLHGLTTRQIKERCETLYTQLGIEAYINKRVEHLSTGMLQKVSIARAVVHQPDVLVLDEPTTGLDIMATEAILEFILQQKQIGRTVIFSSHHLEELSYLADKIAIIVQGESIYSGSIEQLKQETDCQHLRNAFMHKVSQGKG